MNVVVRFPTPVLCVTAEGGPAGAPAAFERLERAIGGTRGRRFLGSFHRGEYRACVVRQPGDDPAALGLAADELPGGIYARMLHRGPPRDLHETFARLLAEHAEDPSRPSLEEYLREDEVWALLPVATPPA